MTTATLQGRAKLEMQVPGWLPRPARHPVAALALVVFVIDFAIGQYLNSRGFLWNDALSRAFSAVLALHGRQPHLAAIGLVWMPLPTLLNLVPAAVYPVWPSLLSSGAASSLVSASGGGLLAALLLMLAKHLALSMRIGIAFALAVSLFPLILLYEGSGMSEGLAAPFLTGAVGALGLYLYTRMQRYLATSAVLLALGFACVYEAGVFALGALIFLAAGMLAPLRPAADARLRLRGLAGRSTVLLAPMGFVLLLWLIANWAIEHTPFYFLTSAYGNASQTHFYSRGVVYGAAGDAGRTFMYVTAHTWALLVPLGALFAIRLLEHRFLTLSTFGLTFLAICVPYGLLAYLIYTHSSDGSLRFFLYPLYVAAGWGLVEVATAAHRRRALAIFLAGWIASAALTVFVVTQNTAGSGVENSELQALASGKEASTTGYANSLRVTGAIARYLVNGPLRAGQHIAMDSGLGWPIAAQVPPRYFREFVLTTDSDFLTELRRPREFSVRYLLEPDPAKTFANPIAEVYPSLWSGRDRRFALCSDFRIPDNGGIVSEWRLYAVEPALRPAVRNGRYGRMDIACRSFGQASAQRA